MSNPIRPNPPGIMQCTTTLTPTALFRGLRELIDSVEVVTEIHGKVKPVLDKAGKPAQDVRYDHDTIQIVSEDELRIDITWENVFGYTVYTMTCNMRARDPCPVPTKDRNGKDVLEKFVSIGTISISVPDVSSVVHTITTCRERIYRETERLKAAGRAAGKLRQLKKFVPRAQLPRR